MQARALALPTEAERPRTGFARQGDAQATERAAAHCSVRVVREPAELLALASDWDELAAQALEPNVFYESWMLLPALQRYADRQRLAVVLVSVETGGGPAMRKKLCGVFPLEQARGYRRIPIRHWRMWRHDYCFLCTPLVHRDFAAAGLNAFFDWLAGPQAGLPLLDFQFAGGDGPLREALDAVLLRRGVVSCVSDRFERAVLRCGASADEYIHAVMDRKRRKECVRQQNRLAELGKLEFDELTAGGDVQAWTDEFLALEAAGWKGRAGSALASSDADRRLFTTIATEAFRRGRLMLLALRLDGRAIAMKCNFLAGAGGFAFKIAYDEQHASLSPGVALELENIRRAHARGLAWMDSCAERDHFMANRLWAERRVIEDRAVAGRGGLGRLLIRALPTLRRAYRAVVRKPKSNLARVTPPGDQP